jgi:hypothetical protein
MCGYAETNGYTVSVAAFRERNRRVSAVSDRRSERRHSLVERRPVSEFGKITKSPDRE